jgi:hypothetical protein
MIPGLEKDDAAVLHNIDDPMLKAQPSGPDIGAEVLEGFGFAESCERVAENVQDQVENSSGVSFVIPDPELKILEELGTERQFTLFCGHRPARRAASEYLLLSSESRLRPEALWNRL